MTCDVGWEQKQGSSKMFVAPHSASDSVQVKAIGKGTAKAHGLGQPGEGGAVTGRERSREGSETGCRTGCRNGRRFSLSPSAQSCHHSTPADVSLSHLPAAASWAMRPLDSTHEHEKIAQTHGRARPFGQA